MTKEENKPLQTPILDPGPLPEQLLQCLSTETDTYPSKWLKPRNLVKKNSLNKGGAFKKNL